QTGSLQWQGEIQWGLSAELDDHTDRCSSLGLVLIDSQHVFKSQRFKVEPVAGVVVGRYRLRVAIDHDGFITIFTQRKGRVAAAVIELDALADAVWPAP